MTRAIALTSRLAGLFELSADFEIILIFTIFQFFWLGSFMNLKIALVNLLPTVVFLAAWTLFVNSCFTDRTATADRRWQMLLLLPALILTLRIPITVCRDLYAINWLMLIIMAGFVIYQILKQFPSNKQKTFLLITGLLVIFNSLTHLGLNSPYTYTFRLMGGLPSAYSGVPNDDTWECPYENPMYCVHCDARHFIASEKIFTEPEYDPSFSVLLRRYFYGYLGSLVGLQGNRYIASICLNVLFWFLACVSVYRICVLTKRTEQTAGIAMLCCASAWGFVDMVGQPFPYLLAYALAPIVLWATLELIYCEPDRRRLIMLPLIILTAVMVYDAYHLVLASAILLMLHKKYRIGAALLAGSLVLPAIWRSVCINILGTLGNVTFWGSGDALFKHNVVTWWDVFYHLNFSEMLRLGSDALVSYLDGNLIIGVVAALLFIFTRLKISRKSSGGERRLLEPLIILNVVMLLATVFIAPFIHEVSTDSCKLPRFAFYSFPINLIALVALTAPVLKRSMWVVPVICLIAANLDLTGLASLPIFFDYGRVAVQWK